jgi:hypothetical protein
VHLVVGVVVNLPEDAVVLVLERAEVALVVRVVVVAEIVERLDLLPDGGLVGLRQGAYAIGLDELSGDAHCLRATVVELGDCFAVCRGGHDVLLLVAGLQRCAATLAPRRELGGNAQR